MKKTIVTIMSTVAIAAAIVVLVGSTFEPDHAIHHFYCSLVKSYMLVLIIGCFVLLGSFISKK